jgi:TolB-like protein/DNA-binding winged helix-turn-helix (wHTH) protein/Tfp pilus assembly protein PilF
MSANNPWAIKQLRGGISAGSGPPSWRAALGGVYSHDVRCRFGLFDFDPRTSELRREGVVVKLSPQPARVLALLVERPGEVVLRDEFRAHLWGKDTFVDFERGLNFSIQQVRAALGDSAESPRFVQTVPRKGYRFIAPVTVQNLPAPAVPVQNLPAPGGTVPPADRAIGPENTREIASDARANPAIAPGDSPPAGGLAGGLAGLPSGSLSPGSPGPGRLAAGRTRWWVAVVAAAVILAPLVWLATAARTDPAGPLPANRLRIAVLPVANLTGSPEADYLADGITDELIAELGRVSPSRLAVIARTSAMAYRGTTTPLAEIGRQLDVAFVIEGGLHATPDGYRVNSRLVPVRDQAAIAAWTDDYARDGSTIVRLARDAARRLLPEATAPNLPPRTAHHDAWDAYLTARHRLNAGTPDAVREAIADLERALRIDPAFAGGWALVAEAQHLLVMLGAARPLDAYPAAKAAADRAIALDATLADAHLARGLVQLWHDWRPADAARSFARALDLNGSHAAAHHDYAWSLVALERDEEAIAHIATARDLDPLSARANTDIGWLFLHLRRPADAARACERTLAIHPRSLEARACLERAGLQRQPPDAPTRAAWRTRLDALRNAARTRWVNPYTLAVHEALLGDLEAAVDHLEAAYDARAGMMVFLARDPAIDPLRRAPRLIALLDRINESRR